MLREVKPRNARSARALKAREPKEREGPKSALFLKSSASSSLANDIAKDLCALKKPHAVQFSKKNEGIHPFEDASSLEFFSNKNDAPLLCFASHSKKRPHTLTFVRTFDAKVLDMLECTIVPETTRAARQFGGRSLRTGIKPMLAFSGEQFEEGGGEGAARFRLAKSMFADFFRGEETTQVDVEGLQALISFAAAETPVLGADPVQTVHMRVWRLVTKRSGQRLPRVELEEIGPRVDFRLRRVREADPEVLKVALKVAKGSEPKTKKNIDMDALGDKTGRIHLGRQDLSQLQTRKMKGLKRGRDEDEDAAREGGADGNEDDEVEDESGDDDDAFDGISDDDDEGGAELAMSDDGEDDGVRDPISPKRPRLAA